MKQTFDLKRDLHLFVCGNPCNLWCNQFFVQKFLSLSCLIMLACSIFIFDAHSQVTANFSTFGNISGCSPLVVNFKDLSTPANKVTWNWSFGNSNSSTQKNPIAIYVTPGTYTVTLTVKDSSDTTISNTLTKTAYITVFAKPAADFAANPTGGCPPQTIQFSDSTKKGDAGIKTWLWDFGDGKKDTVKNPVHVFPIAGSYTITIVTQDSNGCQDYITKTNYIQLSQSTAGFSASPTVACDTPLTVNFTNSVTGTAPYTYYWDFGDGDTASAANPTHTYTALGSYTAKLKIIDANGCKDSITYSNYVNIQSLTADFSLSKDTVCAASVVQFTDNSTASPNQWLWDFGDGGSSTSQNPKHTYTKAGTYTITLTATNVGGCTDSIVKTDVVTVFPMPIARFTADTVYNCELPLVVNFKDSSSLALSWLWNFGDGTTSNAINPTHTYNTVDSFTVSLTVKTDRGCTNTMSVKDFIQITPPKALFKADKLNGCVSFDVTFTDTSTSVEPITSWKWDFGNGSTSTSATTAQTTYTKDTSFNVSLIITNSKGCTDTTTKVAYINGGSKPKAEFVVDTTKGCITYTFAFSDSSKGATEWLWSFGDGTFSTQQNPTHLYGDTGYFDVRLISTKNGCRDTMFKPAFIHIIPPKVQFNLAQICYDTTYTVVFTDMSIEPSTWSWDFGDGSALDTKQHPTHSFPGRGSYDVTLSITDTLTGCTDSRYSTITLTNPIADFKVNARTGCAPFTVNYTSTSLDANSYSWDLGNSTTSNLANPTAVYQNPGVYPVQLIITDVNGCQDTMTKTQYITALGPFPSFSGDTLTGCTPLTVNFKDATVSDSGLTSMVWNFGDGTSVNSFAKPTPHTYTQSGLYTVSLTVTDKTGCTISSVLTDYVQPTFPIPAFAADNTNVCLGQAVNFTSSSSGVGLNYLWDFGDGTTDTSPNPSHTYAAAGTYTVSLDLKDINNCNDSLIRKSYITVQDPVAKFGASPVSATCPPLITYFTDSSSGNISSWYWEFGDGAYSTLQNPSHIYVTPGNYTVKLTTTVNAGCIDTVTKTNLISLLGPNGTMSYTPDNGCTPTTVAFTTNATTAKKYTWDFGDGIVDTTGGSVSHTYTTSGNFTPILILEDAAACLVVVTAPTPISIYALPVSVTSNVSLCKGDSTTLTASGGTIYSWSPKAGLSDSTIANPVAKPTASTTYTVTVQNGPCFGTNTVTVTVDSIPNATVGSNRTICNGQSTTIGTAAVAGNTYSWTSSPTGFTSSAATVTVTPTTTTTYTLTETGPSGCSATNTVTITVAALPLAAVGSAQTICSGQSVILGDVAVAGNSYKWTSVPVGFTSTLSNPTVSPIVTTKYILTETDTTTKCFDTNSVVITVNPLPKATVGSDKAICSGKSTTIGTTAVVGNTYDWSSNPSGFTSASSNPTVNPTTTTTYTLRETITATGCDSARSVVITVNPLPAADAGTNAAICIGKSTPIGATQVTGSTYSWTSTPTGYTSTQANPTVSPTVTTTYNVTETITATGCLQTNSVTVTVNPLPVAKVRTDTAICLNVSVDIGAATVAGNTYSWTSTPAGFTSTISNPTVTPTDTTTYSLTETITATGCIKSDSVKISVKPLPAAKVRSDTAVCLHDSVSLGATAIFGNTYSWTATPAAYTSALANPTVAPADTNTYFLTETNPTTKCSQTDTVKISVKPLPVITLKDTIDMCFKDTITLTASGGVQYLWFPTGETTDSIKVSPASSMNYAVKVTNIYACMDTDTVRMNVFPLPVADAGKDTTICPNTQAYLHASGGDSYRWRPPYGLDYDSISNPVASLDSSSSQYIVEVMLGFCKLNDTMVVSVDTSVHANFTLDPDSGIVSFPVQFTNGSRGAIAYQWFFGDGLSISNELNPSHIYNLPGEYTVVLVSKNQLGCTDTATYKVIKADLESALWIPTAFTPNKDGKNEVFQIIGYKIKSFHATIFDRWGTMMFDWDDMNWGWDGTFKNGPCPQGVYLLFVKAKGLDGRVYDKTGTITLIR